MSWTALHKLQCVERELRYRNRVYAERVRIGTMTKSKMDREISIMTEIADDYRAQVERDTPMLGI